MTAANDVLALVQRVIHLDTIEGFIALYEHHLDLFGEGEKRLAYAETERTYEAHYKRYRYNDYESFKMTLSRYYAGRTKLVVS